MPMRQSSQNCRLLHVLLATKHVIHLDHWCRQISGFISKQHGRANRARSSTRQQLRCPDLHIHLDISLTTYWKLGTGAAFLHPISRETISDKAVQFVDDTSQFLNPLGASISSSSMNEISRSLHKISSHNSKIWSDCMWISGGNLNDLKCYY